MCLACPHTGALQRRRDCLQTASVAHGEVLSHKRQQFLRSIDVGGIKDWAKGCHFEEKSSTSLRFVNYNQMAP